MSFLSRAPKFSLSPPLSLRVTETLQPHLHRLRRSVLLRFRVLRDCMAEGLFNSISSLSLEDDDPIILPDSPRFRVFDENATSILGRLLNPDVQSMAKMIYAMPRVWRMIGRVRGIALSREKFQFIFKREEDLQSVLADRPWSYDNWTMLLERWIPSPPSDFLTSFDVWIRIRNIPMNHFTIETMNVLGKAIGRVVEIAYNPEVSQKTDFVRVKVHLKVADPARASKNLTIPPGETVVIQYEYEKLRKRCFHCLRLTHEKALCPFLRTPRSMPPTAGATSSSNNEVAAPIQSTSLVQAPRLFSAPLGFGPIFSGLSREENNAAQLYISHADPTERNARILRLQQASLEGLGVPYARLPIISSVLDKGKGHVFDFVEGERLDEPRLSSKHLFAPSISAPTNVNLYEVNITSDPSLSCKSKEKSPTVFDFGASVEGSQSGHSSSSTKRPRRRPPAWKRKTRPLSTTVPSDPLEKEDSREHIKMD